MTTLTIRIPSLDDDFKTAISNGAIAVGEKVLVKVYGLGDLDDLPENPVPRLRLHKNGAAPGDVAMFPATDADHWTIVHAPVGEEGYIMGELNLATVQAYRLFLGKGPSSTVKLVAMMEVYGGQSPTLYSCDFIELKNWVPQDCTLPAFIDIVGKDWYTKAEMDAMLASYATKTMLNGEVLRAQAAEGDLADDIEDLEESIESEITGVTNLINAEKTARQNADAAINSTISTLDSKIDQVAEEADEAEEGIAAHVARTDNPHGVTKLQVGLGNVDDTADADKPISDATQAALDLKADAQLVDLHILNYGNPHNVTAAQLGIPGMLALKQDKLTAGENITIDENNVISAAGSLQEQSDWEEDDEESPAFIKNKPTIPTELSQLSADATHRLVTDTEKTTWNGKQNALTAGTNITISGNTISATVPAQVQSDWNKTDTTDPAFIKNKPTVPTLPIAMNNVSGLNDALNGKLGNSGNQTISGVPMLGASLTVQGSVNANGVNAPFVRAADDTKYTAIVPEGFQFQPSASVTPTTLSIQTLVGAIAEIGSKAPKFADGTTFDFSEDGILARMVIAIARQMGATVTNVPVDFETGASVALSYGINPTNTTTFGDLETAAGLSDSNKPADLI